MHKAIRALKQKLAVGGAARPDPAFAADVAPFEEADQENAAPAPVAAKAKKPAKTGATALASKPLLDLGGQAGGEAEDDAPECAQQ